MKTVLLYGLGAVAKRKREEAELKAAKTRTLSFSLAVIRVDGIRNEYMEDQRDCTRYK